MKTLGANLLIVLFVGLLYWLDIFSFFAKKGALALALILVLIVFVAGYKVLGNPLGKEDEKNDKD